MHFLRQCPTTDGCPAEIFFTAKAQTILTSICCGFAVQLIESLSANPHNEYTTSPENVKKIEDIT